MHDHEADTGNNVWHQVTYPSKYTPIHFLRFTGTIGVGLSIGPPSLHVNTQKYRNGEPYHKDHEEEPVTYVTRHVGD